MTEKHVFDSGLVVIEPIVLVPPEIPATAESLAADLEGSEFSFLIKGGWTTEGFLLEPEIYLPKQVVTGGSVDYEEDLGALRRRGFRAILHAHPAGSGFSLPDEQTINSHFDVSLLWSCSENRITMANIGIPIGRGLRLHVEGRCHILGVAPLPYDLNSITVAEKPLVYRQYWEDWLWTGWGG